jgi:uncharacterized protein (TIGR03000 family)
MYTLVLASMLTMGGAEAPNHCYGCHGCYGCWGSCYGCCGGYSWGCHGCWGCCGGCCGGYYSGCWGCCGGCCGYYSSCYGCCGGCCGGYYSSCYGCCGGCWGGSYYYAAPANPVGPPPSVNPPKGSGSDGISSQATVTVRLPDNAKLFVDGQAIALNSSSRTFVTPQLERGKEYYYTIKAEWNRDGKTVSDTKRVVVQSGKTSSVEFADSAAVVKDEAPAHITVRLPESAKLYVDGQLVSLKSDVRSFSTPPLAAGKKYYYVLKTETGKKTETRKVVMEAGQNVEVDFNQAAVAQAND